MAAFLFSLNSMRHILLFFLMGFSPTLLAQKFTLADTLRGALSADRICFDVTYYHLSIKVDVETRSLSGVNHVHFKNVTDLNRIQLDLFDNMVIDSIVHEGKKLEFFRKFNAVFVEFSESLKKGGNEVVSVHYHGEPIAAKNAPWDGGFVWKTDPDGKPWVGVACEGTGASLWWPNKDHLSDEPDSMLISCSVPIGLMCVANGDPESTVGQGEYNQWNWKVSYPINNYNVTLNIADYIQFSDLYRNSQGSDLRLDYYVLKQNEAKAREQFQQVHGMMDCFEAAFGPYPFYNDGYALVETPYLGMEHQGAIAYGNKFLPGYLGRFPQKMDFDYIIIHETGHEWWGNSVSMKDAADMWIHESFCTYSEAVFAECKYGYQSMIDYLVYQRGFINNRGPIYGVYGVNQEGNSGDMYYKGSWMIHTFRTVLNNDSLFRHILKGIAQEFAYRTVDGDEVIGYINKTTGADHSAFFKQYLKYSDVPVLEYRTVKAGIEMRWNAEAEGFSMPIVFSTPKDEKKRVVLNNTDWISIPMSASEAKQIRFHDELLLITSKKVS
jgi:aminopeptidase N